MQIVAFDDPWSYFHFGIGFAAYFLPVLAVIYIIYEIITWLVKKEPADNLLGDLVEFSAGLGLMSLFFILQKFFMI